MITKPIEREDLLERIAGHASMVRMRAQELAVGIVVAELLDGVTDAGVFNLRKSYLELNWLADRLMVLHGRAKLEPHIDTLANRFEELTMCARENPDDALSRNVYVTERLKTYAWCVLNDVLNTSRHVTEQGCEVRHVDLITWLMLSDSDREKLAASRRDPWTGKPGTVVGTITPAKPLKETVVTVTITDDTMKDPDRVRAAFAEVHAKREKERVKDEQAKIAELAKRQTLTEEERGYHRDIARRICFRHHDAPLSLEQAELMVNDFILEALARGKPELAIAELRNCVRYSSSDEAREQLAISVKLHARNRLNPDYLFNASGANLSRD